MFLSDIPAENLKKQGQRKGNTFLAFVFLLPLVLIPGESRAWESVVLLCFLIVFYLFCSAHLPIVFIC